MVKYINKLTKEQFLTIHDKCYPLLKTNNKVHIGKENIFVENYFYKDIEGIIVVFYEFDEDLNEDSLLPTEYHFSDFDIPVCITDHEHIYEGFLENLYSNFISEMIKIFGKPYVLDLIKNKVNIKEDTFDLIIQRLNE